MKKERYEILDGLRGVVAIMVVIFHLCETYLGHLFQEPLAHGYMTVDFFFILSGYVIGYAYDNRWAEGMTAWKFLKRRIVRLHPMVVIGSLFGFFTFYFTADGFPAIADVSVAQLVLLLLISITLLRVPRSMDLRGFDEASPLNAPVWSLFFEYIANFLYAAGIHRLSRRMLSLFVFLSALLIIDYTFETNVFGLVPADHIPWGVNGGFCNTWGHLYMGMTRVLFSFFAGLLLYRSGWKLRVNSAYALCSLALCAVLLLPIAGGGQGNWQNAVYECTCLFIVFPTVVAAGAGSRLHGRRWQALCRWMGEISYPLYLLHYPLIYIHMAWYANHPDAPLSVNLFVCGAVLLMSLFLSHIVKDFEMKARKWLGSVLSRI